MSRWLSFLLAYFVATGVYWAFLRQASYTFPDNLKSFAAGILGRQLAIMTDPIFWLIVILLYGILGSKVAHDFLSKS